MKLLQCYDEVASAIVATRSAAHDPGSCAQAFGRSKKEAGAGPFLDIVVMRGRERIARPSWPVATLPRKDRRAIKSDG
jgi:hypothetical protein